MSTMNLKVASECLVELINANVPTMLWGAPGVGKSQVIDQVALAMKRSIIDIRASIRDPVDLRGIPVPDLKKRTTDWLAPNELPNEKRDGKFGILKLDELNTASLAMQAACFGLVLERKIGEYKLPDGWVPVAAGNRLKDKSAANRMPTALSNRFAHIEVEPHTPTWVDYAVKQGYEPLVIAFLRFRPELLHKMPTTDDDRAFPTPRSWEQVAKICNSRLRLNLVEALIGHNVAIEFEAFCRIYESLPTLEEILNDPAGARLPAEDKIAQLYALSTGLARAVTRSNFDKIVTYVQRMPKEFEVMAVTDVARIDVNMTKTPAFTRWAVKNQEVMI